MDLFENLEDQPQNLQILCLDMFEIIEKNCIKYHELHNFQIKFEKIGYTFEYGLDAEPYNLKKIKN